MVKRGCQACVDTLTGIPSSKVLEFARKSEYERSPSISRHRQFGRCCLCECFNKVAGRRCSYWDGNVLTRLLQTKKDSWIRVDDLSRQYEVLEKTKISDRKEANTFHRTQASARRRSTAEDKHSNRTLYTKDYLSRAHLRAMNSVRSLKGG